MIPMKTPPEWASDELDAASRRGEEFFLPGMSAVGVVTHSELEVGRRIVIDERVVGHKGCTILQHNSILDGYGATHNCGTARIETQGRIFWQLGSASKGPTTSVWPCQGQQAARQRTWAKVQLQR